MITYNSKHGTFICLK